MAQAIAGLDARELCCKPRNDESLPLIAPQSPLTMSCCPSPISAVRGRRLTALGFTVAPDGLHPFGTSNCCVYLADGTYLEPLAVNDREKASATRAGRKRLHRARRRLPRRMSARRGSPPSRSPRKMPTKISTSFRRPGFRRARSSNSHGPSPMPRESSAIATFRLAFAADPEAPDIFVFTCQRLNAAESGPQRAAAACKRRDGHRARSSSRLPDRSISDWFPARRAAMHRRPNPSRAASSLPRQMP